MAIDKNYAPKMYCATADMTEEEWENERRKALGGSDMAIVLGMSPFEGTRLSVYNEKIGNGFSGKLKWFADNYRTNNILVAACIIVNKS